MKFFIRADVDSMLPLHFMLPLLQHAADGNCIVLLLLGQRTLESQCACRETEGACPKPSDPNPTSPKPCTKPAELETRLRPDSTSGHLIFDGASLSCKHM